MGDFMESHLAYLGLGSNLGDKGENLRMARQWLGTGQVRIQRASSIYKTSPVDYLAQDWFLNQVLEVVTELLPSELLEHCLQVETRLGRQRSVPKGPRLLDVDILFYDDLVMEQMDLLLPHPRIPERKFVLAPMEELNPHLVHPVLKKTIQQLWAARDSDPSEVERL